MPIDEPRWWYADPDSWPSYGLAPAATLYRMVATARYRWKQPYVSRYPVICVGNFTAGGNGKTPLALLIANIVRSCDRQPWFLSRGYGGTLSGPLKVDVGVHRASDVGDEPMLLSAAAPTVISRDRARGALLIEELSKSPAAIVMDDGLQNPTLAKDLTFALIDRDRGLGNARVIPAGPLRLDLAFQSGLTDAIVLTGSGRAALPDIWPAATPPFSRPVLAARVAPSSDVAWLNGRSTVAYAGIANPQRFFSLLLRLGVSRLETVALSDHQPIDDQIASRILNAAINAELIVTTEKDFARLEPLSPKLEELKRKSRVLPVSTVLDAADHTTLVEMIRSAIDRNRLQAQRRG